jgi:pyridoxine/pyridoxamine 5'-phosphate oxidase
VNKFEIIETIRKYPSMQLATVDEKGMPHTRGMLMYSADENGIIFHTGSFKTLYKQLENNPNVEASFFDTEKFIQIRVSGKVEEIKDMAFKEKIANTPGREFLKPIIAAHGLDSIKVYNITNCRATVWSMATNMVYPKPVIDF